MFKMENATSQAIYIALSGLPWSLSPPRNDILMKLKFFHRVYYPGNKID